MGDAEHFTRLHTRALAVPRAVTTLSVMVSSTVR